jgi:K+-sensing histidine kinase KdpD
MRVQNSGMKTQELPLPPKTAKIELKRILVPVDFSPLSKKALQYAMRFAEEFHAAVALVHVIEPEVPLYREMRK